MHILIRNLRPWVRVGLAWQATERGGEFIHIHTWVHKRMTEIEVGFSRSEAQVRAQQGRAGFYVVRATPVEGSFKTWTMVYAATETKVEIDIKYNEGKVK